jgi:uncharacterized membrane protein YhaH (DUF805 family)
MEHDIEQLVLGRISRSRFWMSMSVLGGSWVTIDMVLGFGDSDTKALRAPLELMFLIACLMLQVKRCHDRDRSGWFVLVALVPPFTIWYLIETLCLRGTKGSNRFGRDPLSSKRARVKWRKGLRQQRLRARRARHIPSSTCRSMSGTQPFPAFNGQYPVINQTGSSLPGPCRAARSGGQALSPSTEAVRLQDRCSCSSG